MVNKHVLQGRLTADPVLRATQSGVPVCSFRVAWSEKIKDNEEKLFIQCTAWRATGEFVAKYFSKGQEILLEGKVITRTWQDKDDSSNRSANEMTVEKAHFCGSKKDNAGSGGGDAAPAGTFANEPYVPIPESDLPF